MRAATEDWLASAQDDLETVGELIDNDQLTHIVAFHTYPKSTSALALQKCLRRGAAVY